LIPPAPGFLEGLRKVTQENGLLLIFDEVVTGFRLSYGGAQTFFGVTPDICTLGKVIGGGFPLAAIAGRADIMAHFDRNAVAEDAFLLQIGTLSGNPIAAAAGLKTLEILKRPGAYEQIFNTGQALMKAYKEILQGAHLPARVVGVPPMFDVVFTAREVRDYRSAVGDEKMMKRLSALLRERGVLKSESKHYVSLAHTPEDVRVTQEAFAASIKELA
jgi:glutamate-1-semialdehyde 2,1-aminomutase